MAAPGWGWRGGCRGPAPPRVSGVTPQTLSVRNVTPLTLGGWRAGAGRAGAGGGGVEWGQPSGAGTVTRAGIGAPNSSATTSLTVCTPPASEPDGPTWYITATA